MSALDIQSGGHHYKDMAIQPIEYIYGNGLGYLEGNVIKYVSRHDRKNGAEDIKKAIHYLELILELEYGEKIKGSATDNPSKQEVNQAAGNGAEPAPTWERAKYDLAQQEAFDKALSDARR